MTSALYEKYLSEPMLPLCGPTDQHTSEHYMELYILSLRLSDEKLQNTIMDLVRHFYACDKLSVSPSRLEYIYHASTTTPHPENMMKRFLITTAAFRSLAEGTSEGKDAWGRDVYVSGQMKALLEKNQEIMADLLNAVVRLHRDDMPDVRMGGNCVWHMHEKTKVCAKEFGEAWQST